MKNLVKILPALLLCFSLGMSACDSDDDGDKKSNNACTDPFVSTVITIGDLVENDDFAGDSEILYRFNVDSSGIYSVSFIPGDTSVTWQYAAYIDECYESYDSFNPSFTNKSLTAGWYLIEISNSGSTSNEYSLQIEEAP
ncbi:MAG TPA: hypothetical protein PK926_03350 [Spirochaetota bacterium]|nr:hypothetical protein [Spirochaetota bacterium]HPI88774.1 hypothetical protein [Spirochaetota bacterium]HPR47151.1 hypothetical protein [Spirochaetota bacterium]